MDGVIMRKISIKFIALFPLCLTGCLFSSEVPTSVTATISNSYLYVASGICNSPAVGAQNGNRYITKFNLSTGASQVFYDFNADGSYDQPGGMIDLGNSILVADNPYDNSAVNGKTIVNINKTTLEKTIWFQDANNLPAGAANTVRGIFRSPYDGDVYISTSTTIQKIDFQSLFKIPNYSGVFANGYFASALTAMGATSCNGVTAVATTLFPNFWITPSGKAIIAHGVGAQNKFSVAPAGGVNNVTDTGGNCLSSVQGMPVNAVNPPTLAAAAVNNIPNTLILHQASGKLLVGITGTAASGNLVVSYTYNDSTGAVSTPTLAYYNTANLYQPTAMVEDPSTGNVYVASYGQLASGAEGFIRKFTVNPSTGVMTDAGMFAQSPIYTKCISGMFIGQ